MIKFTRLTNSTRDKFRPPLMGILPNAALLAKIPQVQKNKPARKPARTPAPGGASAQNKSSPPPVRPPAAGEQSRDRANHHNARAASLPATWRKNTPQPGLPKNQPNEKKSFNGFPVNGKKPSAVPGLLPQAKPPVEQKPAEPSQNAQKDPSTPPIRSSRLAPGPRRNKLFMDRSVPGVRSIPDQPVSDRPSPVPPVKENMLPRSGSPAEEKPASPKQPGKNAASSDAQPPIQGAREIKGASSQVVPGFPGRGNEPNPPVAIPAPGPAPKVDPYALALEQLLARHPDLPAHTAVLGVCDDGLPVLFDLFDPAPGAMAIIGDEREAQLGILRSIISSTAQRNTPRGVQILILSVQPGMWQQWIAERGYERHCLAITDVSDESVREWTLRMADWTEQRRLGQRGGPPVLMVMDTLSFLPKMAYDVRLNFDWMAKEAPAAAIWPLAAISTELALSLGSRMLRGFQSRILGYAKDPSAYPRLANMTEEQAASLRSPGSFAVQVGENWLCFHLPEK